MEWPAALVAQRRAALAAAVRSSRVLLRLAVVLADDRCWSRCLAYLRGARRCPTASARSIRTTCAPASTSRSSTSRRPIARDEAVAACRRQRDDPSSARRPRTPMPPVVEKYPRGMLLVPRGQPITERQLDLLEGRASTPICDSLTPRDHWRRGIALFLIFSLLAGAGRALRRPLPDEPGAEPADDRRRLRPGAGDAGPGHCCSAGRRGTPCSFR